MDGAGDGGGEMEKPSSEFPRIAVKGYTSMELLSIESTGTPLREYAESVEMCHFFS